MATQEPEERPERDELASPASARADRAMPSPRPPTVLPYRHETAKVTYSFPAGGVPLGIQVLIGVAGHWVVLLAFAKFVGEHDWGMMDVLTGWIVLALLVVLLAGIAAGPLRWRGLIIGVLIGIGTSCFLSPVFLCYGKSFP